MIDWLKAILGIIVDDNEKLVALTDPMPEPEAEMWAQRLRAVGIGAAVQNLGLPPYTSSCLLYTSPSPRDGLLSRMPSSA